MTFDEIIPAAIAQLRAIAEFVAPFPILDQEETDYNTKYQKALQDFGVVIVLVYDEGEGDSDKRRIDLSNTVLFAVVVNPTKYTTFKARELGGILLRGLCHSTRSTEAPGRHQFTHDPKAISRGPLDAGLNTYFVTLRIKSLDTLTT